ncbi:MAG: ExeM/NucH family extracellular endonuclease [Bacteroidota bacterium]
MTKLFTLLPTLLFSISTYAQITPICAIQGSGADSPFAGQTVTTTGVVTAVFNSGGDLGGFFMQEDNCDGDNGTSDGIFVYDPGGATVVPGDSIDLTGEVSEFFGLTEISNLTDLTVVSSTIAFIPTDLSLPLSSVEDLEAYEGMLVRFPQELTVTDHFNWARFGEVTLSSGDRLIQPSNVVDPNDDPASGTTDSGNSNVAAVSAIQDQNDLNRILVDDASTSQYNNPPPFLDGQGTFRAGSKITGLVGALSYGFGNFRVQPVSADMIASATRPQPPFAGTSDLHLASFNVLNYWTTIGGWGAQSVNEFNRQQSKTVAAIAALDADVIGLMELENNGTTAYDDLLNAVNDEVGNGVYAALGGIDPGIYPTRSVIFYKPASVTPLGPLRFLDDPIFERASLSQIFETNDGGGRFNYVLNHFRFKGCDGATGLDLDQGDGQACFNETRRQQSLAMLNFIDTISLSTGIDQVIVVGDFNAYAQEDPIDIIEGAGYNRLLPLDAYTFSFFGQWGALDHAFASSALLPAVTGAEVWHVNSDEPRALGWEDVSSFLYQEDAYRSSDHDPVSVTLDKDLLITSVVEPPNSFEVEVYPNPFSEFVTFTYKLERPAHVQIEIFDTKGRKIAIVENTEQNAGNHSFTWEVNAPMMPIVIYNITVTRPDGDTITSSGKLQCNKR